MKDAPNKLEAGAMQARCGRSESEVFDYFLDLSEGCENAAMKQHVNQCSACSAMLERFQATEKAFGGQDEPPLPGLQRTGSIIGGYEVQEQIGEGGMGSVWKAKRSADAKTVALKLLFKRLTSDPQFVQRFLREAGIGVKLDHPNLVKCYEVGEANGCYFMALEFIDGQDLGAVLNHRTSLGEAQALAITAAAARGMNHAHASGLIHRDIKPANLMLTRTGQVKVMDFGLAHTDSESNLRLTVTGALMGTPHYISPEQVECKLALDARCDMYSLGSTLFHMLTGRPPFIGRNMYDVLHSHVNQTVPDPRSVNATISEETAKLVLWMCARDREKRLPSMERLIQAIGRAMGLPSAQNAPGLPVDFSTDEIELDFESSKSPPLLAKDTPPVTPEDLTLQIPTLIQPMEPVKKKPSTILFAAAVAGFAALVYLAAKLLP